MCQVITVLLFTFLGLGLGVLFVALTTPPNTRRNIVDRDFGWFTLRINVVSEKNPQGDETSV